MLNRSTIWHRDERLYPVKIKIQLVDSFQDFFVHIVKEAIYPGRETPSVFVCPVVGEVCVHLLLIERTKGRFLRRQFKSRIREGRGCVTAM
jgi:hypothetical protein